MDLDLILTIIILIVIILIIVWYFVRIFSLIIKKPETGWEHIKTDIGTVTKDLNPEGEIRVEGIIWRARSKNGEQIKEGERVRVVSRDGMTLIVEKP
ncbi:MAG: NfeD family protein [Thermoplasmata archaeon]